MTAIAEGRTAAGTDTRRFYVWMASACAIVAFVGFAPTYWLNLSRGTIHAAPIMHIHGALFFSWTIFFVVQTSFVASGRVALHRAWGLFGIALASAMVFAALGVISYSNKFAASIGQLHTAEVFSIVSFSAVVLFAVLVGLAIANVSRPEHHKRWMLLATISLLQPAVARWFIYFLAPPAIPPLPPAPVYVAIAPGLISDLLIVAAMTYDWRTRGRVHPVYIAGGAAIVIVQLIRQPLSETAAWLAFAHGLTGLFG